jgi:LysM repeat protein
MKKLFPGWLMTVVLMLLSLTAGLLLSRVDLRQFLQNNPTPTPQVIAQEATLTPTETLLPRTPLATLTPSKTLLPPPTFEPPTLTPPPSVTPTPTSTQPIVVEINVTGIRGAETATPVTTPGCQKNKDWKLEYTVKFGDTLSSIAAAFGTNVFALAQGNCLDDPNRLIEGQKVRVPGEAFPVVPAIVCEPIELLQPLNNTQQIPNIGRLTFNWRGPRVPITLIRVEQPSGKMLERVVELRQNETFDLYEDFKEKGWHKIWILPMDSNYVQACKEGGPWQFYKDEVAPTPTPTLDSSSGGGFGGS